MNIESKTHKANFLFRAKAKYKNQFYDYSKVKYVDKNTKVVITCPQHGDFRTTPKNFLSKRKKFGCPYCGRAQKITALASDKQLNAREIYNVKGGTKRYTHLLLQVFS